MIRRALLLALAALLVVAASAPALSPPVQRPFTPKLRQAGWIVDWPSSAELVQLVAGDVVEVSVRPRGKRPPARRLAVRIALRRVDPGAERLVAQRRLRRGTFRAKVPAGGGASYVLTIAAGGRTYRSSFTPLPPMTPPVVPPPSPPQPPVDPCIRGDASMQAAAALTLDRTVLRNGETFTATIVNTGEDCLIAGYPYGFERPVAGGWERVPSDLAFILPAFMVSSGGSWASQAQVLDATAMPPGRYRIVKSVIPTGRRGPDGGIAVSAEFDVVAP